jgi:hypothetical protein
MWLGISEALSYAKYHLMNWRILCHLYFINVLNVFFSCRDNGVIDQDLSPVLCVKGFKSLPLDKKFLTSMIQGIE